MLDIKLIRENAQEVKAGLKAKNVAIDFDALLELDKKRRGVAQAVDELRSQVNSANEDIGRTIKEKKDAKEKIAAMKDIARQIDELQPSLNHLDETIQEVLLTIPNLPHASVPIGGPADNVIVRSWGKPMELDFKPKTHIELAESLDIIDFKRAAKSVVPILFFIKGLEQSWNAHCILGCWMCIRVLMGTLRFFRRFWLMPRR